MNLYIPKIKKIWQFVIQKIRFTLTWYKRKRLAQELLERKPNQLKKFEEIRIQFESKYEQIKDGDFSSYVTNLWRDFNNQVSAELLDTPSFDFLKLPTIRRTMMSCYFLNKTSRPNFSKKFLKRTRWVARIFFLKGT